MAPTPTALIPGPLQAALKSAWMGVASVHSDVSLLRETSAGTRRERLSGLLSELQFLCGLLHCIFCLSVNLQIQNQDVGDGPFDYVILDEIRVVVKNIAESAAKAPDDGLVVMTVTARFYRDLASQIATFAAYNFSVLHHTLSAGQPLPTSISSVPTVENLTPTLEKWLDVLNSRQYDRIMLEWASERGLVQARREFDPGYQLAVMGYAKFARTSLESNLESIKDSAKQLFAVPATNNFIQWAVELARSSWPDIYDFDATVRQPVITLIHDISLGRVTPLHYAAMLGLVDVVIGLLLGPQHTNLVNATGCFGTPLYCALVGSRVLQFGCRPSSWDSLIVEMGPADATLIKALLARGASGNYSICMQNMDNPIPLTHVAFVAATLLEDPDIFTMALDKRNPIQRDFKFMLSSSSIFYDKAETNRKLMSRIATVAFDHAMFVPDCGSPWLRGGTCYAIGKYMHDMNLYFNIMESELPFIGDDEFANVVRWCVADDDPIIETDAVFLERLAYDLRFDSDLCAWEDSDEGGTIVHLAVRESREEAIEELIRAYSDFEATDSQGRTPLMFVEDLSILSLLMDKCKAKTTPTDKNGQNIWHIAAARGDFEILERLCKKDPDKPTNINAVSHAGRTPLGEALMCFTNLGGDITNYEGKAMAARTLLEDKLVDVQLGTTNLPMTISGIVARLRDDELARKLAEVVI
ncbi:hypothetical protein ED733_004200 [Metarhizium rileyi]|uniref:Uncharacterized protein n=1 Tax=Metarhizium rileyi (strain RCEF 4871) TaxID=1649241 RepID=A0A5C6GHL8_METRR|nr:hypothetical protein ED733_004200 [Metarhizium rileyi]